MKTSRDIKLRISLACGREHEVVLPEDSPELLALYTALSTPGSGSQFVQLPLDDGRAACSFQTSQLVSIVSAPPVVLNTDADQTKNGKGDNGKGEHGKGRRARRNGRHLAPAGDAAVQLRRPRFVVVDDFLSPQEHDELLAYAQLSEEHFQPGTVTTYDPDARQNLVILNFGESVHSRLIENRLLIWFPLLAKGLGMAMFPLADVESQLTAAGDGYFFRAHSDEAPDVPRALTCLYYLHREPRGFAGGDLRLYDCLTQDGSRRPADTFTAIEPVANRLVVFPSEEFHEAMPVRCPSKKFADNRFAVTTWLHRAARLNPSQTFGWGHFRCGVVASQFAGFETSAATGANQS